MKVCFFISQIYQLGGAERLAFESAIALCNMSEYESVLVYTLYSSNDINERNNINKLRDNGVEYESFDSGNGYFDIIKTSILLRRKLLLNGVDIIELSTLSPMIVGLFGTLFSRKIKVVFGVHQVYLRKRESSYKHSLLKVLLILHRNRINYYISSYVKNAWLEFNFRALEKRIESKVIYNSILDDYFYPRSNESNSCGGLVIAYVGRLAAYKRIDIVYEAYKELIPSIKDITLLFIGGVDLSINGTKEILNYIEDDISSNDYSNVHFTGFVDSVEYLKKIDILIHPTEIEGFGLSLVEALASGCYVIASDAEAIPEVIGGSKSSIINNPTPELIAREVLNYVDFPKATKKCIQDYNRAFASRYKENDRIKTLNNFFKNLGV